MDTYIVLSLLIVAAAYFIWRRKKSSVSYIQLNNRRIPLSEVQGFPEEKIAALITSLFQSKGYRVQNTRDELHKVADFLIEKEGSRGFVSVRHWGATKVGVSQISQEVIGMNQQNSDHSYIFTTGRFEKEASEMAKYNRNLFLVDGRQLNIMIANAK
ncbi:restriction endonuclease [Advenella sp. WQ 585]|uniref:Restriction endonuclease n=1 Tax=Advenella mandrilli TaxID=2800330 RepID=A0ABS1EB62_9BURK|nr:restriction endonuclease [Advenella mandrilli]MBK1780200.1 restriction endonuclease [Advenella mandrilli]